MRTYDVYITRNQISRQHRSPGDSEKVVYHKRFKAAGFRAAAERAIGEIWALCDDDIRVISVYVGIHRNRSAAANRMAPIQFRR